MFEKVSRSLKYDSKFFLTTNIYIYTRTPRPITLSRSRCACGLISTPGRGKTTRIVVANFLKKWSTLSAEVLTTSLIQDECQENEGIIPTKLWNMNNTNYRLVSWHYKDTILKLSTELERRT